MDNQTYVSIDLGSNSFHMLIARDDNGTLQIIDKLKVMVQLAAGLNTDNTLDEATKARALETLSKFGERIKEIKNAHIRCIGTSTLRRAKDNEGFIDEAEHLLGAPIEIISGQEEARLIYLGVCSDLPHDSQNRLVIDIGGGSTEFIIGTDRTPIKLESLNMGCISFGQRYGKLPLDKKRLNKALQDVELNLQSVNQSLRKLGWHESIGASGSIKAISRACEVWFDSPVITQSHLKSIAKKLSDDQASEENLCEWLGFEPERAKVFTGGFLVLYGAMRALDIKQMIASENAIREGVFWELVGRTMAKDIRHQTVDAVMNRFSLNYYQAHAVQTVALHLFEQVEADIPPALEGENTLRWASQLHEIGLAISHSSHHKHGAYLTSQMDMAGFSKTVQLRIARLIRLQRKKISLSTIAEVSKRMRAPFCLLVLIIRLSTLLCRSQQTSYRSTPLPYLKLIQLTQGERTIYQLTLDANWVEMHPLTATDLDNEAEKWDDHRLPIGFEWTKTELEHSDII